ncbi:MAG: hypothetical protein Q4D05_01065 [Acinetobacter sp.]|nr:hypothetical protein [Acinetobacter sp.]
MFRLIVPLTAFFLFTACQHHTPTPTSVQQENAPQHILIIYYDAEIGKADLLKAVKRYPAQVLYEYHNFNAIAIQFHGDMKHAKQHFQWIKGVLAVNENQIMSLHDE